MNYLAQRYGRAATKLGGRQFSTLPQFSLWQPTQVTTLANGLRVATQRVLDVEEQSAVTMGVWIGSGSRDETAETNGTAHFLEHLSFKGTKKRSRVALEKELENTGASLNAYTAREHTTYFTRVFKGDMKFGMDILSDILLNSKYEAAAIEEERSVILRETQEVEKSFEEVLFDRLHMTSFRDCSLGYTILGPEENIRSIRREQLMEYVQKNYVGENMVVVAAGDVDHGEFVKLVEAHFGAVPRTSGPKAVREKPYFLGSELIYRDEEMGSVAYFALGFEGVGWKSPTHVPFMLMQAIIGKYKKGEGFMPGKISGNRVTSAMANKMNVGCTEEYSSFNASYSDTGLWGYYVVAEETALEHALGELLFGTTALSYSVTDEEVERAKKELMTSLYGNLDSTTQIAEDIGRQLLTYGRRIPPAEFAERLSKINADEIKKVAWNHLHMNEITVCGIGPTHGYETLNSIHKQLYWMRY